MWDATLPLEVSAMFSRPPIWDVMLDRLRLTRRERAQPLVVQRERMSQARAAAGGNVRSQAEDQPCRGCGKKFDRRERGVVKDYCAPKCRQKAYRARKTGGAS